MRGLVICQGVSTAALLTEKEGVGAGIDELEKIGPQGQRKFGLVKPSKDLQKNADCGAQIRTGDSSSIAQHRSNFARIGDVILGGNLREGRKVIYIRSRRSEKKRRNGGIDQGTGTDCLLKETTIRVKHPEKLRRHPS